jgi:hypothetical protein
MLPQLAHEHLDDHAGVACSEPSNCMTPLWKEPHWRFELLPNPSTALEQWSI